MKRRIASNAARVIVTPIDDAGHPNSYPMMRLVARNGTGTVVAKSDIVLPVSGEMDFLGEIRDRIRSAQTRAHLAVSRELILLYWQIGRDIVSRQKHEGWGKSVIERLASDVQKEFPSIEGLSARNIWRMRGLYLAYSEGLKFLPRAATELDARLVPPNAEPSLAQAAQDLPPAEVLSIPWFHNVILIEKVKNRTTRLWYARQAALHGWSRNILALQIESGLHKRQGKAVTNFSRTLPPPQSDLVQQITKDPYNFDFLTRNRAQQSWVWVRRETGKPLAARTHEYHRGQPGDSLLQKLQILYVSLEEEEAGISTVVVAGRARAAFDIERVTKAFYRDFDAHRIAFLKFIDGIGEVADREWYASVMLNRLMFVYFIQRKGFLDGDHDYLRNRLDRCKKEHGKDKFYSFYRYFLLRLFLEGFG